MAVTLGEELEDGKREALSAAMKSIEREHGKGSIMVLGNDDNLDIEGISTGSIGLDWALGGAGIPRGRVIEIFGPESSGKSTICMQTAACAQQMEQGVAAYIDAEHALDPNYARKLGLDLDNLLLSQPDYGEQALEICETLVRSNAVDLVVIDSVAALVPRKELEGEMGDDQVALQARLMSKALRKLTSAINKSNTSVIFTNQIREKVGVQFGNPETTSGGRALKFYSSVRVDLRRRSSIKDSDGDMIGNSIKARVVKNKTAPPFRDADLDIMYNEGVSRTAELITLGQEHEVVERAGSWYSYGDEKLGQGKQNARDFLEENPDVADEIEEKIKIEMEFPGYVEDEEEADEESADDLDTDGLEDEEEVEEAEAASA
jgi:recombination protein RecA